MLRGDDVAELQQRLCALGFDTGRVDGIFGDATVRGPGRVPAQRGLPVDGIVGGATLRRAAAAREPPPRPRAGLGRAGPRRAARRAAHPARAATSPSARAAGSGSVAGALRRRLDLRAASGSPSCTTPTTPCRPRRPTSRGRRLRRPPAQPHRPRLPHRLLVGHPRRVPRRAAPGRAGPGGRARRPSASPTPGSHGMSLPLLRETRMPAVAHRGRARPAWWSSGRPRWPPRSSAALGAVGRRLLGLITGNRAPELPLGRTSGTVRGPGDGYAINASGR